MYIATKLLARLGAPAAALGGLMWAAKVIYEGGSGRSYPQDLTDALLFVVPLLLLVGFAGLYLHCRGRLGEQENLSLAGFILGSVGLAGASISSGLWALGVVSDVLVGLWGGTFFVALGLMLLGGSILQAGLLGHWKAVPLIVGVTGLLAVAMPPWNLAGGTVWGLFGFTWVALGYVLRSGEHEIVRQNAPVR